MRTIPVNKAISVSWPVAPYEDARQIIKQEAITVDDVAHVNRDRCIGCGLCVTTCSTGAMSLQPKPADQHREPPPSAKDAIMQLAKERGKDLIPLAFSRCQQ